MRHRLRDLNPFRKPVKPPVPISTDFYLSVLAARAPLPSISDLVTPKGESGRVAGMGVPLSQDATKDDLTRPMARGVYAFSSPDRKTVLKLRVLSKEEARFDAESIAASAAAFELDEETRRRIHATWTLMQLTYESFDPVISEAVHFMLSLASRLAELTDGVVADPLALTYRLPGSLQGLESGTIDVRNVLTVRPTRDGLTTAGLLKFAQPEICVSGFSESSTDRAKTLLASVAAGVITGKTLSPGDRLNVGSTWIVTEVPSVGPGALPVLELLPDSKTSVDDALSRIERLP